jgi:Fe2+ or Zn2+ uptake regulation protein
MPTPKTKVLAFLTQVWNAQGKITERRIEQVLVSNRFNISRRGIRRLMRYFEALGFVERIEDGFKQESYIKGRNDEGFAILGYRQVYRRAWRGLIHWQDDPK